MVDVRYACSLAAPKIKIRTACLARLGKSRLGNSRR